MATLTQWISTTPDARWQTRPTTATAATGEAGLALTGAGYQTWEGFGGCFNELGWVAMRSLSDDARAQIFDALFDPATGCRFSLCRLPIGASDYGAEWYSHNETDGDFAMEHFSIARDREYLLPYIKLALARQPAMRLFASPWSPPTWLKHPKAYNYGTLIWQPEYLNAYALYFRKFIEAYRAEGVTIHQVHVQNEPLADQKFPSCVWTGAQLRDFIGQYLGPHFAQHKVPCEIWLGTLNTDDYDGYAHTVLSDAAARRYTAGVGYQWAGKGAVQRTYESWPDVRLMQTENECGDGKNTWEYARYIFELVRHYISNGVVGYIYWNMVLAPGGESTWGWHQNAMITVDPATREVTYNPEFYVMQHFAHFITPGAQHLGLRGPWTGNATAFRNPNGEIVLVVGNPFSEPRPFTFTHEGSSFTVMLDGGSFNTFVVQG